MNRAIEIVKENPWKITLGTIITVMVSVGSVYFTDQRYIKRDEYQQEQQRVQERIEALKKEISKHK